MSAAAKDAIKTCGANLIDSVVLREVVRTWDTTTADSCHQVCRIVDRMRLLA